MMKTMKASKTMKKGVLVAALVWCGVTARAQDFSIQWLDTMTGYLGQSVRDIPKGYGQNEEDRSVNSKTSANRVTESFSVDSFELIQAAAWIKESRKPRIEYSRLLAILETALGEPMFNDGELGMAMWDWRDTPLMLQIQDETVIVGLVTLEAVGMTKEEWDQVIKVCTLMRSLSE
jgi:hypothetical protein